MPFASKVFSNVGEGLVPSRCRDGFLQDQPKLISVEKVAESELEGYRYYQEAMGAGR